MREAYGPPSMHPNDPPPCLNRNLILAIHHLKSSIKYKVRCRHVYDHQDSKKGKEKEARKRAWEARAIESDDNTQSDSSTSDDTNSSGSVDPGTASLFGLTPHSPVPQDPVRRREQEGPPPTKVLINIACDGMATGTSRAALDDPTVLTDTKTDTYQPPYAGSKAMLRIGDQWITCNHKRALHVACHPCGNIANKGIVGRTTHLTKFTGHQWAQSGVGSLARSECRQ